MKSLRAQVTGAIAALQSVRARRGAPRTGRPAHAAGDPRARHAAKVARVVAQLRAHAARGTGRPVSLRKHAPPHQVPKGRDLRRRDDKIDVSDLTEILSIDPVRRVCVAESGVTFVDLIDATLSYGLVPIVVPELASITVGGAVAGCSLESMSFRAGGFHDTCREYEVVTATGEVLTCRPDNEHALVFQMMHGAFGTLGILTELVFALVPAGPFVHVEYERYTSAADYLAAIARHAEADDADFIDGMIHRPDLLVLCVGRFVQSAPYTSRYDWMKIYYRSTAERAEDFLTTRDYLLRYDRGVTNVRPSSFVGRLLLGKWITSARTMWLANQLPVLFRSERPVVTVDLFLPLSRAAEFLAWYEQELGHYPLWCVPYRRVRDYEWLADSYWSGLSDRMFVDLAIYGMKQPPGKNVHRMLEDKLRELGGIKTLISHNYYSRDEFWSIWNRPNYDRVKAITDPDNVFRDLWSKTCRAAMGLPG